MSDLIKEFQKETQERITDNGNNINLKNAAEQFNIESNKAQYSYNFSWMGRPIIQYPQDILAMQEIIWEIKPDIIIETGVAHGGSVIYYASLLELIGKGEVVGIDVDIRQHNRNAIENHQMIKRINLIEGSSISEQTIQQVKKLLEGKQKVIVVLDSNHTHDHVLEELKLYAPLVSVGSYIVVFDTIVEDLPDNYLPGRLWSKGNNPKTAVHEFLKNNNEFEIDTTLNNKLLVSVAPDGYLKRVK